MRDTGGRYVRAFLAARLAFLDRCTKASFMIFHELGDEDVGNGGFPAPDKTLKKTA